MCSPARHLPMAGSFIRWGDLVETRLGAEGMQRVNRE